MRVIFAKIHPRRYSAALFYVVVVVVVVIRVDKLKRERQLLQSACYERVEKKLSTCSLRNMRSEMRFLFVIIARARARVARIHKNCITRELSLVL